MSDVFIAEQAINDILNALECKTGCSVESIDIEAIDVTAIKDKDIVVRKSVRLSMGRQMNRWGK